MKPISTKFIFPFLLLIICAKNTSAQSFADLGRDFNDRSIKLFARGTYVRPGEDETYHAWTINGSLSMDNEKKGGLHARYENPTLGDAIFLLVHTIKGKPWETPSGLEHSYGSGWFGWMQIYKNVVAKDRLLIAPGFSLADYIFAIQERQANGSVLERDPQGYYCAIGGGVLTEYLVTNNIWVDGTVNYDIPFYKTKYTTAGYSGVEGYKKPHFITYGIDVNHKSGFYIGVRVNQVIDRGGNGIKAHRTDISIGYHFKDREK